MHTLHIATTTREAMTDITPRLEELLHAENMRSGLLFVYTPHTTALTISEVPIPMSAGTSWRICAPWFPGRRLLHAEGNSDAHIKASLLGPRYRSWSRKDVCFGHMAKFSCEFDGPRKKKFGCALFDESHLCHSAQG